MLIFGQGRQREVEVSEPLLDNDASAFVVSFLLHLGLIVSLGLVPMIARHEEPPLLVRSAPVEEDAELKMPAEFAFSDLPSEEIGAQSVQGDLVALSVAPTISDVSAIPNHLETIAVDNARIEINEIFEKATGLHYAENLAVKGAAGEGTTGAAGAIDRITHEILLSLEERKTLVVWLFDSTASLIPQRKAIRDRFAKIYNELGIVESSGSDALAKYDNQPLLSSVVGFGSSIKFMTDKPTDDLTELKQAVMGIPNDDTGTENVFSAINEVAKRYASYRHTSSERGSPERNVMIVVFTDEAGSDVNRAEETIKMCRRWAMPVYVIGVPAPFGRKEARMKWIDPDRRYSQEEQWGVVDQGPESLLPERIKLDFAGSNIDEEPIDSGFGPYALTRLCFETGGIYFAVHPNRNVSRRVDAGETAAYSSYLAHFFDPEVMRKYRPEYVSIGEYQKRKDQNKARAALIEAAAQTARLDALDNPRLEFIKTEDEAEFSRALTAAQQAAAALEPKINALYQILQRGEADRDKEAVLRWQAGYDLAMGRALAAKVRTETYNAMLAAAKRGLKPSDPKHNVWTLERNKEISVGSNYAKLAERARMYLERVVKEHPDTPWAMLARQELAIEFGWKWRSSYRDLTPRPAPKMVVNNNPRPAPAPPPPPRPMPKTRPVPKL